MRIESNPLFIPPTEKQPIVTEAVEVVLESLRRNLAYATGEHYKVTATRNPQDMTIHTSVSSRKNCECEAGVCDAQNILFEDFFGRLISAGHAPAKSILFASYTTDYKIFGTDHFHCDSDFAICAYNSRHFEVVSGPIEVNNMMLDEYPTELWRLAQTEVSIGTGVKKALTDGTANITTVPHHTITICRITTPHRRGEYTGVDDWRLVLRANL